MAESNLLGQQVQGYTIVKKLGSGGYGTVYLGTKEDLGKQYQTAIKHISMPDAGAYESVLEDYNYDKAATQVHFEKLISGITSEINTLLDLSKKDNRYIVAYYDHDIQKYVDPLRFEIFMRMEYLTPLNRAIRQNGITIGEVIKLGLNMSDALMLCHNNGVMHRDIKEANIFLSETGNYKLGDFGVAKVALETTQAGSMKGTASYMAPEIYLREPYDKRVDIYSLGIVMYKLLNNQRLPFMPDAPAVFTADDKNSAEAKRLRGETPPLPFHAKNRLGEIIVKACAMKDQRYATAEEMKKDLSTFISTMSIEMYDTVVVPQATDSGESSNSGLENSISSYTQTQGSTMTMGSQSGHYIATPSEKQNPYADKKKPKSKAKKIIVLVSIMAVLVLAGAIALYMFISNRNDPVNKLESAIQIGDYSAAIELYGNELRYGDSNKRIEAEKFIASHAESVKTSYINLEIEYEEALTQLQELEKLEIVSESEITALIAEVNEMRTSRAAYEGAINKMESGDYQSAIENFRKVIQVDSNYSNAQTQLSNAVSLFKDKVFAEIAELEANKLYDDAISSIQAALLVVPEDADFLAKISDFEKKIADEIVLLIDGIIRNAKNKVSTSADYDGAFSDLHSAISTYPNNEALKTALFDMETEFIAKKITEANNLVAESGDYATAMTNLRTLNRQFPNSAELRDAITLLEVPYVSLALDEAGALAGISEYEKAVAQLNKALINVPNNESLRSAITAYEAKYPVLLQQITYFTGSSLSNGGQGLDNIQGAQVNIITSSFSNTYKLNGEYKKITGVIFQPFDYRSSYYTKMLVIYGDSRLLYSTEMQGGIEPKSFSVDLTGVKDLSIVFYDDQYYNAYASLANVQLYQ